MKYRRKNEVYVWHWWSNCTEWPTEDYVEVTEHPGEEAVHCRQCMVKTENEKVGITIDRKKLEELMKQDHELLQMLAKY